MTLNKNPYRAIIELSGRKLTIEGPKDWVEEMFARYATVSKPEVKPELTAYTDHNIAADKAANERDLIAMKRPRGHHEIVAVLAFALAESGRTEFTEEEIRRAYIHAGVRPPKVVAQAIRDAKNNFDYVEPTGSRGLYRLTAHGDRVVRFDLPRQGAAA